MSKVLNVINKEAVLRSPGTRGCPFGLSITTACKNAGDSIHRMTPLDEVEDDRKLEQAQLNKKVYAFHAKGERCIYADKIVKRREAVHCDYGEYGAGLRDFALRPSPYYARVFYGLGQYGLFSYPIGKYNDGLGAQQTFTGLFSAYASGDLIDAKIKVISAGMNQI